MTEKRWSSLKELADSCGNSLGEMVDDLKGFNIAAVQLTAWLGQKEKMMSFLGPLAAEPVMIRNQIQQLEVIVVFVFLVSETHAMYVTLMLCPSVCHL